MSSQQPQGWDYAREEYVRPGARTTQMHDNSRTGYTTNYTSASTPSLPPSTRTASADNVHRRSESQHRSTQRVTFSNSSDVSMSSTKASTGSSPPPSIAPLSSSHHSMSLRPSRITKSAGRPSVNTAPTPVRSPYGLEQPSYGGHVSHIMTHTPERHAPSSSGSNSQPSIFSNPHGIREAPAPLVLSTGTTRPSISTKTPSFNNTPTPGLNHLGLPGYVAQHQNQHQHQQMPGAFPSDPPVPYRRPTDVTTQLSMSTANESADHFSSNSDSWDSEGDSGSCLSTSTDATTVASDITVGKNETYQSTAPRAGSPSSGSSTPTQTYQDELDAHSSSRLPARAPRSPTVVRRAGHKSVLSSGSRTSSSVSSMKSTSTQHSQHSSKTSTGTTTSTSSSSRRNSQSGGPNIHIEVHRPTSRKESQSDARIRQKIEEALLDKIEQLKLEQPKAKELTPALKQNHTVRFVEPGKETAKQAPTPAPVPTPVSAPSQTLTPAPTPPPPAVPENTLSKELVLQSREIHKLEVELEKRDILIKERERLEHERRAQEDRAHAEREKLERERKQNEERALAEREKEKERARQNLDIQRRENDKERQKERQQFENEKKEVEKAHKLLEKERAKERQQADKDRQQAEKERKEMEKEKARIAKAEKEHEQLQASFIEQGKILSDLKIRFDEQTKTLEATEAERAELKEVKNEFERRCGDLAKSLSHVSNKEQYVVEQVASLQIIKESLQRRVGPLEQRVEKMQAEIDGLHSERDGLMRETKTYLLRITDLEKEIKNLVEEKRGFIAQVGTMEKDKSNLRGEIKNLKSQAATLEANIEARAKEFAEHVADLKNKHNKQVEELDAQTEALKQGHDAMITSLRDGHKAELANLADEMVGLNEHIDGAHADIEVLQATIQALQADLVEEKTKFDVLTSERVKLETELDGHKSLAVSQETSIMDLRNDVAARSDALAKSQDAIKALEAERDDLKKQASTPTPVPAPAEATPEPPPPEGPDAADLLKQNEELTATRTTLKTKTTDLEAQLASTKTELETRITQLETDYAAAQSALAAEQTSKASLQETTAARILVLETEASQVSTTLRAEKANLEAQLDPLRADCARLAEQLAAANKLIEGLTAAQQAGLNSPGSGTGGAAPPTAASAAPSPLATPLSPNFPTSFPPPPESPRMAPTQRKTRSRAPSMVRSVSSRSTASKRSAAVKDDMALVLVRNPADRGGTVQVVRKCDLRTPRSRSQPPDKE